MSEANRGSLVMSQKEEELVIIDLREYGLGTIEVMPVDIRGDKVRNLYRGDKRIPIHRKSVFDAIEKRREEEKQGPLAPIVRNVLQHPAVLMPGALSPTGT